MREWPDCGVTGTAPALEFLARWMAINYRNVLAPGDIETAAVLIAGAPLFLGCAPAFWKHRQPFVRSWRDRVRKTFPARTRSTGIPIGAPTWPRGFGLPDRPAIVILSAMSDQTMHHGQATFLLSFLLPQLKAEQAITHKILSSIPQGQGGYRPHPKYRSALELGRHIALCEIWFLDAVINRQFGEIVLPHEPMRTCQEVAHWYAINFEKRMPVLETLSEADLATPVPYLGLRNDPAVAYLNIAIRHSVHHRGQLSVYLRGAGATVPAIYVESADEPYPPSDGTTASQPPPAF